MNPTEIEFAVRDLIAKPYEPGEFPYELIGIYNASKVTVRRLKSGQTNVAKRAGDVLWKKHLFFRTAERGEDVGAIGDALATDPLTAKHKPRFILVTNGEQVHARDNERDDTLNVEFAKLDENSDFLLPLAGFERQNAVEEHPADIKAAKKLKKLYDAILAANPTWSSGHHTHELNLLMTRLLFCFYAEDTGIFDTPQVFTSTATQHTTEDGSDIAPLLDRLFRIMNIEEAKRPKGTPAAEAKFPYVNGSLFEVTVEIPQFNRTARRQLLECGDLDWTTINPDIFGSMIQTIAQDGTRSDLGMHYTSVPNIMKVLQPLFLDELHEAYEKAKDSVPKLEALLGRLSKIRVFDPACGSGNFLIVSYKALRQLEIQILVRIGQISPKAPLRLSGISLQHFYGIDVVDFACETAKLSLWIAEHQMNTAFKEIFGTARPTLPLGKIKTIHCANSTRMDWSKICPFENDAETYICGNPPYIGSKQQSNQQQDDVSRLFAPRAKVYKNVDYIACFLLKAAEYISKTASDAAFVSTNSICQGEQVAILWPLIFDQNVDIFFAHRPFKWQNNASNNAGVTCVIIGLAPANTKRQRKLFSDERWQNVAHIGPYLVPGSNIVVRKASQPLNRLPAITKGNMPMDGGNLLLSPSEMESLISRFPNSKPLIRRFYGAEEFIDGLERYCLWITDETVDLAKSIPPISERIQKSLKTRLNSGRDGARTSLTPHRFGYVRHQDYPSLIIPEVSSERRSYLQIGILGPTDIASNLLYVCYDPPAYLLSVLSSRMHRIWSVAVGGGLETRLRYSNALVYNTFPIPSLSQDQQRILSEHARAIVKSRAKHPGHTIAWLYNPDTMPENLLRAHEENDTYIERCLYGRAFKDDTQRLEHLFEMYGHLKKINDQDDTLFQKTVELV